MVPSWRITFSVTVVQSMKKLPRTPSPVYTFLHLSAVLFLQLFCRGCWTMNDAWGRKGFPIMKTCIWYCVPTHGVCRSCFPPPPAFRLGWDSRPDQWHQAWITAALKSRQGCLQSCSRGAREGLKCHYSHKGLLQRRSLAGEGRDTTGYWWPPEKERCTWIGQQQGSARQVMRGNSACAQVWILDKTTTKQIQRRGSTGEATTFSGPVYFIPGTCKHSSYAELFCRECKGKPSFG